MTAKDKYPLFSNGTEFMWWQAHNCEQCVKAVWYNQKKDFYPKYRCAVQKQIELASVSDGKGDVRVFKATHSAVCPYRKTKDEVVKTKRQKELKGQMELWTN